MHRMVQRPDSLCDVALVFVHVGWNLVRCSRNVGVGTWVLVALDFALSSQQGGQAQRDIQPDAEAFVVRWRELRIVSKRLSVGGNTRLGLSSFAPHFCAFPLRMRNKLAARQSELAERC